MKTPKTPIEFDYDLWTAEDGKCMVRVKITGEVTEVDREVMNALRAEEKRIRRALRSNEGTVKDGIAHQPRSFSLSAVSENEMEKSDWLVDPTSDFANVEARLFVKAKGMRQIKYHDLRHPYVKHTTKILACRCSGQSRP